MLCWQDCIDMCDLDPEEECVVRDSLTLAELGAALSAHERLHGTAACGMVCHHFHLAQGPVTFGPGDIFTYRLPPPSLPHFGHPRHP